MKKILIIGATSSIAESAARLWAMRGDALYLVARDKDRLKTIARDLEIRGASSVFIYTLDTNDHERHEHMLQDANNKLGIIDILFIAHGTLPDQFLCEKSTELTIRQINNNAISVIALLTAFANVFEEQRCGVIAVISSVAGDRGRKSNYVYGCAKAMITAFMSGLRQRLTSSGICVLTIKPGLVDTPMTKAFKKNFLWATPEHVASRILSGIDARRDIIYVPGFWILIMLIIKSIPERIFKTINFL
jgi:decaprenylphospho-beta-D-erythro-pentofuranosid-2-ulose 2-reductase